MKLACTNDDDQNMLSYSMWYIPSNPKSKSTRDVGHWHGVHITLW